MTFRDLAAKADERKDAIVKSRGMAVFSPTVKNGELV